MGMSTLQCVPDAMLSNIFRFLNYRDRMSCYLVCPAWSHIMADPQLWRKIRVHVDRDFHEPSITILMHNFGKYVTHLEIGWSIPQYHTDATITKRLVRFLIVLYNQGAQLESIELFNWVEVGKINYQLFRFLKAQKRLHTLQLYDLNISSYTFTRLLRICFPPKNCIRTLHLYSNLSYQFKNAYFHSSLEQFNYVRFFKVNYYTFILSFADILEAMSNSQVEVLEVLVEEISVRNIVITATQRWTQLHKKQPQLKIIYLIVEWNPDPLCAIHEKLSGPFARVSLSLTKKQWYHNPYYPFRRTLSILIEDLHRTLTSLKLQHVRVNTPDELIIQIISKCRFLGNMLFMGFLDGPLDISHSIQKILYFCEVPSYKNNYCSYEYSVQLEQTNLTLHQLHQICRFYAIILLE